MAHKQTFKENKNARKVQLHLVQQLTAVIHLTLEQPVPSMAP